MFCDLTPLTVPKEIYMAVRKEVREALVDEAYTLWRKSGMPIGREAIETGVGVVLAHLEQAGWQSVWGTTYQADEPSEGSKPLYLIKAPIVEQN